LNKRKTLRLLLIFIVIGFVISPAFADETTITLNNETSYVDIPVEALEPTTITIQTITGTPQTNTGFIDSWIELWRDTTKLFANDDGAHSATNVLASIITAPIEAGVYFIRATSFAYMCCQQSPAGSYVLTWNGVATIPTVTPTPTIEPSPEPTPTEVLPTPTPIPEITPSPTQEPVTDNSNDEATFVEVIPETLPTLEPTQIVTLEPEIVEQIIEPRTIETPIVEPVLSVEQQQEIINELYIAENTIELQLPSALDDVPGAAQVLAAAEAILNVGSDMTETQREESQTVVVSAIVLTQIASMAMASVQTPQHKNDTKRIKRK
jgi:hypothetical protein